MEKKLLLESIVPNSASLITEAENGFLYLKGLFIQGEVKNHNGRIYPKQVIATAVDNLNKRLYDLRNKTGNSIACIAGELDHPEQLNINFDRISHGITEMKLIGNDGHGTMRLMNEGLGRIARGAIEIGIPVGVSSRGSGYVGPDGMVSDYDIVTIDLVINPSAPDAYPKVSLKESIERSKHGGEILKLSEICRNDKIAQKYLQKEIRGFFKELVDKI